nr:uncharacterized protein LOC107448108 [Parasteatoda tepidariorum]
MSASVLFGGVTFVFFFVYSMPQPEITTPGGILNTICHKGCTEIVVHESNCFPPCNTSLYERCVVAPKMTAEPSCFMASDTALLINQMKRPYICRCHPCLYRNSNHICVPVCPVEETDDSN